jgi:hypothetical protein
LHFEGQWKYPWEHNSNIKREHGQVNWISNPWFGAMPYITWWKSHNLVLYPWFITMWNGIVRKCLVGESFEQCRNKEPIWFSKQRFNSCEVLLHGKSKDMRARDNNTTNNLLAKSLKFGCNKKWAKKQQRTRDERKTKKNLPL